jgi:hypothetical protein
MPLGYMPLNVCHKGKATDNVKLWSLHRLYVGGAV